jgi:hypothetical protein
MHGESAMNYRKTPEFDRAPWIRSVVFDSSTASMRRFGAYARFGIVEKSFSLSLHKL